jgi:hypothetical protein
MDGREPLRQATKLWQEEIDPEFGTPYNDIGVHLMERERLDEALPCGVLLPSFSRTARILRRLSRP